MTSTQEQLDTYRKLGYVVVPDTLSVDEVDAINAAIDRDLAAETPFWIEREDGHVILNAHALLTYKEMDVTMRPPTLMPTARGYSRIRPTRRGAYGTHSQALRRQAVLPLAPGRIWLAGAGITASLCHSLRIGRVLHERRR